MASKEGDRFVLLWYGNRKWRDLNRICCPSPKVYLYNVYFIFINLQKSFSVGVSAVREGGVFQSFTILIVYVFFSSIYPSYNLAVSLTYCYMLCWSENRKEVQGGRDLRRSLVKPPAQSRVSCEMGLGCSRLYAVPSCKPLRMEAEQPLCATYSTAWISSWWKSFSLYLVWISLVPTYAHCVSSSCHALL